MIEDSNKQMLPIAASAAQADFRRSTEKMMKIVLLIAMLVCAGCATHTATTPRDADGQFHGTVTSYWPSGQLAEQSEWDHGVPISGKFYNATGALISEIKNGTGWRHCPGHSEYYQDGKYVRGQH